MADEHQKPEPVPYGPDMPSIRDPETGATDADVRVAGSTGTGGPVAGGTFADIRAPRYPGGPPAPSTGTGGPPGPNTGTGGPPGPNTGTGGPPAHDTGTGGPAAGSTDIGQPGGAGAEPAAGTLLTSQRPVVGSTQASASAHPGRDGAVQFAKAVRAGWARGIGLIASAVMIVAVIVAVILAVHILFAVFNANPHNSIVDFINHRAAQFAWHFKSLFTPKSQRIATLANYGIAAIIYVIAGRIIAGIIRRFA